MEPVVNVSGREVEGKAASGRLRREGRVPGVVYGPGRKTQPVTIEERELDRLLTSGHASGLVTLTFTDDKRGGSLKALVKEVQRDYLKGKVKHIDFLSVAMDHPVTTQIPVLMHGEDQRRGLQGVVQHVLHSLEVTCLPANLPEHITVDVAKLELGHSVHVSDLELPAGVKAVTPAEDIVVSIVAPTRERVEETPADEKATEPAVVAKAGGKEKEED